MLSISHMVSLQTSITYIQFHSSHPDVNDQAPDEAGNNFVPNLTENRVLNLDAPLEFREDVMELRKDEIAKHLLLDFSDMDMRGFTQKDLHFIVNDDPLGNEDRTGGKTAMITPSNLQFGLGRMMEAYAELDGSGITVRSFRTMETAMQWLEIPSSPPSENTTSPFSFRPLSA